MTYDCPSHVPCPLASCRALLRAQQVEQKRVDLERHQHILEEKQHQLEAEAASTQRTEQSAVEVGSPHSQLSGNFVPLTLFFVLRFCFRGLHQTMLFFSRAAPPLPRLLVPRPPPVISGFSFVLGFRGDAKAPS